jgi:SAM-dependent methyltransferase
MSGEAPLVRCVGQLLPFRGESFSGARIERVLQHVEDPTAVLVEAARVLRPRGLLTVFEPDWSRLAYRTEVGEQPASWLTGVRQPGIGGELWGLIEAAGCRVLDRIEELSVWHSLADIDHVLGPGAVEWAVRAGRIQPEQAAEWLGTQRQREEESRLVGTVPKVLVIAEKV